MARMDLLETSTAVSPRLTVDEFLKLYGGAAGSIPLLHRNTGTLDESSNDSSNALAENCSALISLCSGLRASHGEVVLGEKGLPGTEAGPGPYPGTPVTAAYLGASRASLSAFVSQDGTQPLSPFNQLDGLFSTNTPSFGTALPQQPAFTSLSHPWGPYTAHALGGGTAYHPPGMPLGAAASAIASTAPLAAARPAALPTALHPIQPPPISQPAQTPQQARAQPPAAPVALNKHSKSALAKPDTPHHASGVPVRLMPFKLIKDMGHSQALRAVNLTQQGDGSWPAMRLLSEPASASGGGVTTQQQPQQDQQQVVAAAAGPLQHNNSNRRAAGGPPVTVIAAVPSRRKGRK